MTSYTYDLNGNKLTQKDGKGNFTSYEYNAAQKLIHRIDHGGRTWATNKYTYVDGKVESYSYYQNGLLKTKLDRNGVTTNYSYDSFGRMLSQEAGAQKVSYTYDDNGNQLTMTDATGQTVRTYDELNRVVTKTVPQFGTTVFQYDIQLGIAEGYAEDGYVGEKSIDSKGNEALKVNDKVGRLKVVKADSETTGTVYQYDGNGNRTSVTYENGAKEVYTYYDDNLLATLTNYGTTGNIIESYQYTYDAAHNQKTKVDAKGTTSYSYDTLNRLIKVLEPIGLGGKLTEYGYDKAGNRLTERIINGSQITLTMYAYDERNRLLTTTLQTPTGSREISKYVYDNNGNTLQKTKETTKKADPLEKPSFSMFIIGQTDNEFSRSMVINEYNSFNQLVTTKTGAQIANYVYNGEGRRVQKNVNGQATNYLYEYDKVVLETDGKGKQTARNVYGINLLSRTIDSQKVNYLYNGHADVTALIDATGTKVASYYYDAFGNPLETTGTISNPIRYAGYQYDTETGLYYLNARYYDSKIARFLTEDTFRGQDNDPLSLNLYTYCHNEPIMYSDPTGHRAETLGSKTRNDNAVFKLKKQVKANYVKTTKVVKEVAKTVVKPIVKAVVNTTKVVTKTLVNNTKASVQTIKAVANIAIIVAPKVVSYTETKRKETNKVVGSYLKDSGKQLILGNYTDNVTVLGTGGQVVTGLVGIDLPGDIRDITYDVTNWECTWSHVGKTALDVVGVLPIVGGLKYVDEVGTLLKNADEVGTILKNADETGAILKNNDVASTISEGGLDDVVTKANPYSNSRPSYGKGQVQDVWNNAKDTLTGKVYDPSGVEIKWDPTKTRNGQWDMGHIPGEKYSDMQKLYMDGAISKQEFLDWYKNPNNYRPELPSTNRGHQFE